MTPFDKQCEILTDMWLNYRDDENIEELFHYFDIGFPLAFAYHEQLATLTDTGMALISDCWIGVLEALGTEDTGFDNLIDIITG